MSIPFRELTAEEEEGFRQWAHDNYTADMGNPSPLWHPVVQDECWKIKAEAEKPRVYPVMNNDDGFLVAVFTKLEEAQRAVNFHNDLRGTLDEQEDTRPYYIASHYSDGGVRLFGSYEEYWEE